MSKSGWMYFWNNTKWNVSMRSNFKSVDRSFFGRLNRCFRSNKMFWSRFNRNVSFISNCDWFSFVTANWNIVTIINCDYRRWWFFSWFEKCTMNFWNDIKRNVSFISNFESINWSFFCWINSFRKISRIRSFVYWNIGNFINNDWLNSFVSNWNVMFTVDLNNWFSNRFLFWFE